MQKTSFSIWHNSKKDEYTGHSDFGSHIKEISCEFFPTDFISFYSVFSVLLKILFVFQINFL